MKPALNAKIPIFDIPTWNNLSKHFSSMPAEPQNTIFQDISNQILRQAQDDNVADRAEGTNHPFGRLRDLNKVGELVEQNH